MANYSVDYENNYSMENDSHKAELTNERPNTRQTTTDNRSPKFQSENSGSPRNGQATSTRKKHGHYIDIRMAKPRPPSTEESKRFESQRDNGTQTNFKPINMDIKDLNINIKPLNTEQQQKNLLNVIQEHGESPFKFTEKKHIETMKSSANIMGIDDFAAASFGL